jgi:hypothetical protein
VFVEAPSVIISITSFSCTEFAAVGTAESTSPAAELVVAIVIAPPVTAVPLISVVISASAVAIAPPNTEDILIILPASGATTYSRSSCRYVCHNLII